MNGSHGLALALLIFSGSLWADSELTPEQQWQTRIDLMRELHQQSIGQRQGWAWGVLTVEQINLRISRMEQMIEQVRVQREIPERTKC